MACAKVELSRQNRKAGATLSAMNKITQDMRFKQAVIEYSLKHGVTAAAIRYKTTRQNIYRWRKKYDGTIRSLADRSHRPHSHPNQHTEDEIKLVRDMRRRNPHAGLVVFWVKLRQRGYSRSISGLYMYQSEGKCGRLSFSIIAPIAILFIMGIVVPTVFFIGVIPNDA